MRKNVFNGKLIKVYCGEKELPDRRRVCMEEVSHPGGALMVAFTDNRVVFVRQYRAVIDRYIWELPAGLSSGRETPSECAGRELEEETGYVAGRIYKLGVIYTSPGFCDEAIHVFKTVCAKKKPANRDEHEVITVRSFSVPAVKSMVRNGRIVDSKTISALALASII
jgi:ADP-ribose pyrophosphatase